MIGAGSLKKGEERYPLLFLYLEDGGGGGKMDNEYQRSRGLASGAAAVITRWPSHMTTCWSGAMLFGLVLLLFTLMIFSLTLEQPLTINKRSYECVGAPVDASPNQMHLVHTSADWHVSELETLHHLMDAYRTSKVNLLLLNNCQNISDHNSTRPEHNRTHWNVSRGERVLQKIIQRYNINVIHSNCFEYFNNTPLMDCWRILDADMLVFAARIIALWQNAGLSFDLKMKNVTNSITKSQLMYKLNNNDRSQKKPQPGLSAEVRGLPSMRIKNLIKNNGTEIPTRKIQQLGRELTTVATDGVHRNRTVAPDLLGYPDIAGIPDDATTLDADGSFIATRTTCHAFFEQILINIHITHEHSVHKIIKDTLKIFCQHGAVDGKYCNIVTTK